MYVCADGSQFPTEAEADAYEFLQANKAEIDGAAEAFVNTMGKCGRARSAGINFVNEFLAFYIPWAEAGKPVVERTVMEPEKPEVVAEGVDAAEAVQTAVVAEPVEGEDPLF